MAASVASGLAYLHSAGVCHMDVSSPNVGLLALRCAWRACGWSALRPAAQQLPDAARERCVPTRPAGVQVLLDADGRAKLADAGLAVVLASASHRTELSARGTFPYLAPEVLMGARPSPSLAGRAHWGCQTRRPA